MDAVQQAAGSHTWAATPLTSRTNPRTVQGSTRYTPGDHSRILSLQGRTEGPMRPSTQTVRTGATRSWTHPAASSARITEQQRGDEQRVGQHAVEPWPASWTCAWPRAAAWRAPSPPPCRARTPRPWSAAVAVQIHVDLAGAEGRPQQPVEGVTPSCAGASRARARQGRRGCACDVGGRERVGQAHLQPRQAPLGLPWRARCRSSCSGPSRRGRSRARRSHHRLGGRPLRARSTSWCARAARPRSAVRSWPPSK